MGGFLHIFFVANVNVNSDGTVNANVNRFSNDNVWNAKYRHRFVIPKLTIFSHPFKVRVFVFPAVFLVSLFSNLQAFYLFLPSPLKSLHIFLSV